MGFGPKAFKKLHSFLVAADAACSRGDLPVATDEAKLADVTGLATASEAAVAPTELAAAVPLLPKAANGATQPESAHPIMSNTQIPTGKTTQSK